MELLREIMDLPEPLDEANKKLLKTYMVVNGKIVRVTEFHTTINAVTISNDFGSDTIAVKSLEVWLPDAGLYQLNNGQLLQINKAPKRQWAKSFTNDYYSTKLISNPGYGKKKYQTSEEVFNNIRNQKALDIATDAYGYIYYLSNNIGEVKDSYSVMCHKGDFEQELTDWCKQ